MLSLHVEKYFFRDLCKTGPNQYRDMRISVNGTQGMGWPVKEKVGKVGETLDHCFYIGGKRLKKR